MMRRVLGRIISRYRRPDRRRSIDADKDGVSWNCTNGSGSFRWDDVDEIETYKIDLWVHDDICVAFHVLEGWYEFSEADHGFTSMVEVMKQCFSCIPDDWWSEVMLPPFATNQRTLRRRGESVSRVGSD